MTIKVTIELTEAMLKNKNIVSEKTIEMLLNELRDINENMVSIRVHMGIKA